MLIKVDILTYWLLGPFTVCPLGEDKPFGVHLKEVKIVWVFRKLMSKFEPSNDIFGRLFLKSPCFIKLPLHTPASYLPKDARWQ